MGGISPVASFIPSNVTTQSGSAYPALIDGDIEVTQRTAALFAPRSWTHPNENMTMLVDPGHVFNGTTLTEVGHWTSGVFNNGGTNNQVQLVPDTAGVAIGDGVIGYVYVAGVLTLAYPTNTIVTGVSGTTVTVSNNGLVSAAGAVIFCKPIGTVSTGNAHGTTTVDGMQSTQGIFAGMLVAGVGVTAGTTVASVDSLTQIHTSASVTTGSGVTLTFTVPVPVSNPRIDRVCVSTSTGLPTWVRGTESATPTPPVIPAGFAPCCQLALKTSTTAITNASNLSDERDISALGSPPFTGGVLTVETTMSGVALNFALAAAVASGTTVDLGAQLGNSVHVTGTTTIQFFGTTGPVGTIVSVTLDGALTLTNSANLILPGGVSILTAAGDCLIARCESVSGSAIWRVVDYSRASGKSVIGGATLLQVVNVETGAVATGTTAVPFDDTIPQSTEGDQYMSLAIVPINSGSTLLIDVVVNFSDSVGGRDVVALFQDSTANALAVASVNISAATGNVCMSFRHKMTSGTTSSTTFKVRVGGNGGGTITFNGISGSRDYGGVLASSITITEILP